MYSLLAFIAFGKRAGQRFFLVLLTTTFQHERCGSLSLICRANRTVELAALASKACRSGAWIRGSNLLLLMQGPA
ncbi:hypothetical protein BU26DRAFT_525560 [Trematosphaeria pertusa]|uniref:Uncharacterized protein n=1 Tax=Trematosphaeria pertusa TaxID=390896 RepID=A0A6A6HTE5_9PLEO|nr:uncharacterized protein BU26DRAFT_525560 [Trematosphaeria pertusa]KAF2241028.1 hypothetical protein BU26DRAFT_525560 [Trematosphaeria pertusa]